MVLRQRVAAHPCVVLDVIAVENTPNASR